MIKKIFTLLCLCTLCIGSAWGTEGDITVTISSADIPDGFTATTGTSGELTKTVSADKDLCIKYAGINTKSSATAEDHSYGYAMFLKNYGFIYSNNCPTGYYPSSVSATFSSGTGTSGKVGISYSSTADTNRNSSVTGSVSRGGTYNLLNTDPSKLYWNFSTTGANVQITNIKIIYSKIPNTPTERYTVSFNAGTNGTCSTKSLTEASVGAGVTLPSCTASTGYVFKGWATTNDATTVDAGNAGDTYQPGSNCTLYAVYKALYTVTVEEPENGTLVVKNGETPVESGSSVEEGTTLTIVPTPALGYKFKNWQYKEESGAKWNSKTTNFDYTLTSNVSFRANFEEKSKFTINYMVNGVNTEAQENVYEGTALEFPTVSELGGKVFVGWSESEVAETDDKPTLVDTDGLNASKTVTYYAVFAKQNASGGESTVTLTNETIENNRTDRTSYGEYDIEGWTGKYLINLNNGAYSLQLGYNANSTKTAYNSHLTTPISTKTIKSVTIETNTNTTSGRTFYMCATDDLGVADAEDAVYGSGSLSEAAGSVTIDVTGSPTQVHIYPDGTAYIESVSVTYSDVSYSDYTTFVGYTREVTDGNFGTICLPYASSATAGATFYTLAGKKMNDQEVASIILEEVEGNLVAGTPYIFKASDNEITVAYTGAVNEAGSANGLIGTFERIEQLDLGTYIISGTKFYCVDSPVSCGANRAYIDMSKVSQSQAKGDIEMFNGSEPTSINGMNIEIISNSPMYNLNGQRVNSNYNGVVLKNGKKYLNK